MQELSIVNYNDLSKIKQDSYLFTILTLTKDSARELIEGDPYSLFKWEGIAACFCIKGTLKISIDYQDYVLSKNSLIVVLPHTMLQFKEVSDDFQATMFSTDLELLDDIDLSVALPLYKQMRDNPHIVLTDKQYRDIHRLTSYMYDKAKDFDNPYRKPLIRNLLSASLFEAYNLYRQNMPAQKIPTRNEKIFKTFLSSISQNYVNHRDIEFYAEEQCLTPKYFSTIIKKTTGHTATEWINIALINNIKILLKSQDMTIQQISDYLHFPNPSFFGQFFKKHTGMTPRKYRIN